MSSDASVTPVPIASLAAPPGTSLWKLAVLGLMCWVALSGGFAALQLLLRERPQFVGDPLHQPQISLLQESPKVHVRRASEDVAVIHTAQPDTATVEFSMQGHRDYRGLRTLMNMSGEVRSRHTLSNRFPERIFVLFRSPHPQAEGGGELQAMDLRLESSVPGITENGKEAWTWSGLLEPGQSVTLEQRYDVSAIRRVQYRIASHSAEPLHQFRLTFRTRDLDSLRFETGDGTQPGSDGTMVWERREFLAPASFNATIVGGRSLFESLLQLLEIGPIVCLLFMAAAGAVLLARHSVSPAQLLTVVAGHALYFPLILYLSARFSFPVALVLSVVIPGVLLMNFVRLQFGNGLGLAAAPAALFLYQVFPTLAAFNGWNRGMVLLCLGVVTFGVLIQLQNEAARRRHIAQVAAACALAMSLLPFTGRAAEAQVLIPATVAFAPNPSQAPPDTGLIQFEPAIYHVRDATNHLRVRVEQRYRVVQPGKVALPLVARAVFLESFSLSATSGTNAAIVSLNQRPHLFTTAPGGGDFSLEYKVPLELQEGVPGARIPLLTTSPGSLELETRREEIQVSRGHVWEQRFTGTHFVHRIGVSDGEELTIRMDAGPSAGNTPSRLGGANAIYGIGIARAHHLTVFASDGSCTHFAELDLSGVQARVVRQTLPSGAQLISAALGGVEIPAPTVVSNVCEFQIPAAASAPVGTGERRLSLRLALPRMALGFMGDLQVQLPESGETVGSLNWSVAFPVGFQLQLVSSGLEPRKASAESNPFGDYGRIVKLVPTLELEKALVPPGPVQITLRYRQTITAGR